MLTEKETQGGPTGEEHKLSRTGRHDKIENTAEQAASNMTATKKATAPNQPRLQHPHILDSECTYYIQESENLRMVYHLLTVSKVRGEHTGHRLTCGKRKSVS